MTESVFKERIRFEDYMDPARANAVWDLEKLTDEQLWENWKDPMCFICDYGGTCKCSLSGNVLTARGHTVLDRFKNPVPPVRFCDMEKKPQLHRIPNK